MMQRKGKAMMSSDVFLFIFILRSCRLDVRRSDGIYFPSSSSFLIVQAIQGGGGAA
jgi:hypothetical protein